MIWPNADAGSDEISKGIRTFRERDRPTWLHVFINLPIDVYVKLMDRCACMIGNSSSAIREGAFIGVPAVNIGTRQEGRVRGTNIIDVGYYSQDIKKAILTHIENGKYESDDIYGNGEAGLAIAEKLAGMESVSAQKKIAY